MILCISEPILSELSGVLQRPKFGFSPAIVNQIMTELNAISVLVRPKEEITEIKMDGADNRVPECAVEANADYIVSGDAHLPELRGYESIQVVSPQQFMDRLRS
mgnify:CR=1 FL=1